MRRMEGVVIGIVKDLNDPDGQGRIRVEFPWLQESFRSAWAPIAVPLAGKQRGAFFMPEIEDEALVAFEHGDFDHPFVIGFLWNGVDEPPNDLITPSVRRLRTVSGHVVDFDDRAGEEKIVITTQGKHQIEMKDLPGSITIRTKTGHHVRIIDTPGSISIKTANNSIEINDVPPGINISAPAGILTVTCLAANVTSTTVLNVTAPLTVFNGVVQTQTLISQAVISALYNPAVPGNLLGL